MHANLAAVLFSGVVLAGTFAFSTNILMKLMPVAQEISDVALNMNENPIYYVEVAEKESHLNPHATNPFSTSKGLYQFIDSTWERLVDEYGNVYGLSYYGRDDIHQSTIGAILFTRENRNILEHALHRSVTRKELYLAHFAGPVSARNLIKAKSNALVVKILGKRVERSNPQLRGKTVAQAIAIITKGISNDQ